MLLPVFSFSVVIMHVYGVKAVMYIDVVHQCVVCALHVHVYRLNGTVHKQVHLHVHVWYKCTFICLFISYVSLI